ncbi:TetR/AcrR family transcriptional regulator [Nonomuraea sp. NBC_01738]|uniref:TetR family transcriptional regulator n=1 Tax=Nonomuraea sp. NBC_01738 TaxID=2976003 RepID=UPI002E11712C|nr:TetR/AcrR family transcriptional regulator [Nonomuraea sp. NBC_01738]
MSGLRELKKARQHESIAEAAIRLFLERGFDEVSVAEVAAAAHVSKPTLFKYFAAKEDLVLARIADHQGEAARVVRAASGDPVATLRVHFLDGLHRRDPVTGLNDVPGVIAYHRLVFDTPSLLQRVSHYMARDEVVLAEALGERYGELTGAVLAAQVLATQRVLARRTWQRLADGASADAVYPEAVSEAERAFALLMVT